MFGLPEERRKFEHQEEQRFIDAWAQTRERMLQDFFPVTSKRNPGGTHETISKAALCGHKHIMATKFISTMVEEKVLKDDVKLSWDGRQFQPDGLEKKEIIESNPVGQEREWRCKDCGKLLTETSLRAVYPQVEFNQPEIDLPDFVTIEDID